ncbi:MAG: phosphorylase [Gemmatimonadetes bacterium]|nr:phosphorylase [Gemmatimonadota bacterium]NNM04614.1 phosphorylase [Gemmatimonadota bacterium]
MKANSLWQSVLDTTESAVRRGALERIPTRMEFVEEAGVRFQVHLVQQLERKARAKIAQRQTGTNPFLPYDEALFVADVFDSHVCLLNKFNVMDHHLLLVTREFEDQETLLTVADFVAMWMCLREFDSLAFYNSGEVAGASQPHKHLQQVPLPLGGGSEHTPITQLLTEASANGPLGTVDGFPFAHSVARVDHLESAPVTEAARASVEIYLEMVGRGSGSRPPGPYNLLVTREWMFYVPRSVEKHRSISVNALGFAGSFLARDEEELEVIRRRGPLGILGDVGVKRLSA